MKKFILYFSILALCTTLFTSCEKEKYENRIIGAWMLKSTTWYITQSDGSIKETTNTFDLGYPYFEFFDNGMYSMFDIPDGQWEILNGNRLYLSGQNMIYTIVSLTSTDMELEGVKESGQRYIQYLQKQKY